MTLDRDCLICGDYCYEVLSTKHKKGTKYDYEIKPKILKPYIYYDYKCICLICFNKWIDNGKKYD